ncbi:unnamed protein product, partial [Phaeothamnion confervicola]
GAALLADGRAAEAADVLSAAMRAAAAAADDGSGGSGVVGIGSGGGGGAGGTGFYRDSFNGGGGFGGISRLATYNLGVAKSLTGKHTEARAAFETSVAADPSHAAARVNLAIELLRAEETDKAVAEFRLVTAAAAAATGSGAWELARSQGHSAATSYVGAAEEAMAGTAHAVATAHEYLAAVMEQTGRPDLAAREVEAAARLAHTPEAAAAALRRLARLERESGRPKVALAAAERALLLAAVGSDEEAEALVERGLAFHDADQHQDAIENLEAVLELHPQHHAALLGLGRSQAGVGDTVAALASIGAAMALRPGDSATIEAMEMVLRSRDAGAVARSSKLPARSSPEFDAPSPPQCAEVPLSPPPRRDPPPPPSRINRPPLSPPLEGAWGAAAGRAGMEEQQSDEGSGSSGGSGGAGMDDIILQDRATRRGAEPSVSADNGGNGAAAAAHRGAHWLGRPKAAAAAAGNAHGTATTSEPAVASSATASDAAALGTLGAAQAVAAMDRRQTVGRQDTTAADGDAGLAARAVEAEQRGGDEAVAPLIERAFADGESALGSAEEQGADSFGDKEGASGTFADAEKDGVLGTMAERMAAMGEAVADAALAAAAATAYAVDTAAETAVERGISVVAEEGELSSGGDGGGGGQDGSGSAVPNTYGSDRKAGRQGKHADADAPVPDETAAAAAEEATTDSVKETLGEAEATAVGSVGAALADAADDTAEPPIPIPAGGADSEAQASAEAAAASADLKSTSGAVDVAVIPLSEESPGRQLPPHPPLSSQPPLPPQLPLPPQPPLPPQQPLPEVSEADIKAAAAYLSAGLSYRRARKVDHAVKQYRKAMARRPGWWPPHYEAAAAMVEAGDAATAASFLAAGLANAGEPEELADATAAMELALRLVAALGRDGKDAEAAGLAPLLLLKRGSNGGVDATLVAAAALAAAGPISADAAAVLLREAMVQNPADVAAAAALGTLMLGRGEPAAALPHLLAAVAARAATAPPALAPAATATLLTSLGDALRLTDKPEEAVRRYDEALALDTMSGPANYGLGLARRAVGDEVGAIEALATAAHLGVDDATTRAAVQAQQERAPARVAAGAAAAAMAAEGAAGNGVRSIGSSGSFGGADDGTGSSAAVGGSGSGGYSSARSVGAASAGSSTNGDGASSAFAGRRPGMGLFGSTDRPPRPPAPAHGSELDFGGLKEPNLKMPASEGAPEEGGAGKW